MASHFDALLDLARAHGLTIAATSDETGSGGAPTSGEVEVVRLALSGMGVACANEAECRESLDALTASRWVRVLPQHVVLREGWTPWVPVRLHAGTPVEAFIEREDGERVDLTATGRAEAHVIGGVEYEETTLEVPRSLPLGYHRLVVSAGGQQHTCPLVVTPARMAMPAALSGVKAWGISAQLYGLRSDRSWGIGDAADLAELGTWAARSGADYVNVGPVNADDPVPTIDPNPYRPASRRALDPLAIRVEEVRELGYLSAAEHQLVEWHGDDARRLNLTDEVDRDAVWQSKRAALRMVFNVERSHRRRRDFEQFVAERGDELLDYATWCVIAREHGLPFSAWPPELGTARSDGVAIYRDAHADDVEFECWLQWIAGAQFADAAREVKAAGMRIGVMHDVAPGTIDGGFEQWQRPGDHAVGLQAGVREADGDVIPLALAPQTPAALARDCFALWRAVVRDALAISAAVRIDRIGALFTQWWYLPQDPTTGVSVRFDHEALIGILLLEAQRANSVVVAGDEHETQAWIREYLVERGLVSSHVLWHEAAAAERVPDPAGTHRAMTALAAKDAAPAAAYVTDAFEVEVRENGLVEDVDAFVARQHEQRAALLDALHEARLVGPRATPEEQVSALHRRVAARPSVMFTVRAVDLVGDVRLGGAHGAEHVYAYWRLPLAGPDGAPVSLDSLMTSRRAKRVLRVVTRG